MVDAAAGKRVGRTGQGSRSNESAIVRCRTIAGVLAIFDLDNTLVDRYGLREPLDAR